jgi:hypothetical protein
VTEWNSPEMRKAIRRHDRRFARRHGSVYGKPKSGCAVIGIAAVATSLTLTAWSVFEAVSP